MKCRCSTSYTVVAGANLSRRCVDVSSSTWTAIHAASTAASAMTYNDTSGYRPTNCGSGSTFTSTGSTSGPNEGVHIDVRTHLSQPAGRGRPGSGVRRSGRGDRPRAVVLTGPVELLLVDHR